MSILDCLLGRASTTKPRVEAYRKKRRTVAYANMENTVRVTEGFCNKTGLQKYWLEVWGSPNEETGWHWIYSHTTRDKHVMRAWVEYYALLPIASVNNRGYLTRAALDE